MTVTTFRHNGKIYTVSTTDISGLHAIQAYMDRNAGYTGLSGTYETMLFINGDSIIFPFGDMPGHPGLGVFQRYETEEEARDGHQEFVTRVQRILQQVA